MELTTKQCEACSGTQQPLSVAAAEQLLPQVKGWHMLDDASLLVREFTFPNFKQAFDLVSKVSILAEAEGHHPDIAFGWGYCSIALQTHAIGGLHENDFILAAKINMLL